MPLNGNLPSVGVREIVAEEHGEVQALVSRAWHIRTAVDFFFSLHDANADPRVGARHKFSVNLHVNTCSIALGDIAAVINDAYIIYVVWDEIAQCLVVCFGCELEWSLIDTELIFHAKQEMDASL